MSIEIINLIPRCYRAHSLENISYFLQSILISQLMSFFEPDDRIVPNGDYPLFIFPDYCFDGKVNRGGLIN